MWNKSQKRLDALTGYTYNVVHETDDQKTKKVSPNCRFLKVAVYMYIDIGLTIFLGEYSVQGGKVQLG